MSSFTRRFGCAFGLLLLVGGPVQLREGPTQETSKDPPRKTAVTIQGAMFRVNGKPTYKGRTWNGKKIEGLLLNSRMVQAIFDDLNPQTVHLWKYPDTNKWDPERNTREYIAAMPTWRQQELNDEDARTNKRRGSQSSAACAASCHF